MNGRVTCLVFAEGGVDQAPHWQPSTKSMNRWFHHLPIRFTPWKAIGAIFVLVSTFIVCCGVAAFIPAEEVPRIDNLPDGGKRYVLESLRESILLPVALLSFVVFLTLAVKILPHDKVDKTSNTVPPAGRRNYIVQAFRALRLSVCAAGCLAILGLLLLGIVLMPLWTIRAIEVDQDSVRFQSLFCVWSVQRAHVTRVNIQRYSTAGERKWNIHLVVKAANADAFGPPSGDTLLEILNLCDTRMYCRSWRQTCLERSNSARRKSPRFYRTSMRAGRMTASRWESSHGPAHDAALAQSTRGKMKPCLARCPRY